MSVGLSTVGLHNQKSFVFEYHVCGFLKDISICCKGTGTFCPIKVLFMPSLCTVVDSNYSYNQ